MRDSWREVHQHAVAFEVDVFGGDDAELLERDGVLWVGDGADEVWY